MTAALRRAFGYQGDNMNLPVGDVDTAVPFYESILGFRLQSRGDGTPRKAVLARDDVQIGLCENGGDPSQDGCAFHVEGIDELRAAFGAAGLQRLSEIGIERHGDSTFRRFFVVAPDGLCYWFGEKQVP